MDLIFVVSILVFAIYTALTRKNYKMSMFKIIMLAFYGIAFITRIVIMNIYGIVELFIIHKASSTLFVALLTILFLIKLCGKKVYAYSKLLFFTVFGGAQ